MNDLASAGAAVVLLGYAIRYSAIACALSLTHTASTVPVNVGVAYWIAAAAVHLVWAAGILSDRLGFGTATAWLTSLVLCTRGLKAVASSEATLTAIVIEVLACSALWAAGPRQPLATVFARRQRAIVAAWRQIAGRGAQPRVPDGIRERVRQRVALIARATETQRARHRSELESSVLDAVAESRQLCEELGLAEAEADALARECEEYILAATQEVLP